MKFLIDTDHASYIQQESQPESSAISRHLAVWAEADLAYSIISLHEQFRGSQNYLNKARAPSEA